MRKLLAGLAIGVGASALVFLVAWPGWLETAELKTYDWRMRTLARMRTALGHPLVNPDIVLVEITDASVRDLAPHVGRWPWPRALQAMIVDYISSGKPKVIALDLTAVAAPNAAGVARPMVERPGRTWPGWNRDRWTAPPADTNNTAADPVPLPARRTAPYVAGDGDDGDEQPTDEGVL